MDGHDVSSDIEEDHLKFLTEAFSAKNVKRLNLYLTNDLPPYEIKSITMQPPRPLQGTFSLRSLGVIETHNPRLDSIVEDWVNEVLR